MKNVIGTNFAEAHWLIVFKLLASSSEIDCDYRAEGEPLSLDLPMCVTVTKPWYPPIFSKAVWESPAGMIHYKGEVVDGTSDHLVDRLGYTYHSRCKDQLPGVLKELKRNPNTRRAQMITWDPGKDLGSKYPPCFQRGWFRVRDGKLDFHTHWRSRDALKAWGTNVFGFAFLHKRVATALEVGIGVYREFVDSMHIYGKDRELAKKYLDRGPGAWEWSLMEIYKSAKI